VLPAAIRAYQRHLTVKLAVKTAIRLHHGIVPAQRGPCPLAGRCSATGLAEAQTLGWQALPLIWSRINSCGARHRRPRCSDSDGISTCLAANWRWANPDDC
jgi:hypothetical protein